MRQWLVPAKKMCDRHLLGEHVEHHMFVGCINRGRSIAGYVSGGLVSTGALRGRHSELAGEMRSRGFNHKSPLPSFNCADAGDVDIEGNEAELAKRCKRCRERILGVPHAC